MLSPNKRRGVLVALPLILIFSLSFQSDSRIEIYNIRSYTHTTHTRIVIDIGQLREYVFNELPSPDRIYVDIYQAKLNPILHEKTYLVKNEYLNQIRIAQRTTSTVRVVVDINDFKNIRRYNVFHLFSPFRVVIDIYPQKTGSSPPVKKTPQPAKPAKEGYSMARQLGLGVQKIVIDPGHGGNDPGCIGSKGLQEKGVVLDISKRLKTLLSSQRGLEIILTRETDIYVPPENRTIIANQKQADIFVSIHANSFPNRKRSGIETFYLNFNQDLSVMAIAALENATSTKNISSMKKIIEKITQNSKIVESKELAQIIQKNLVRRLSRSYKNVRDLGSKGGPFWVLIGGEIPSVLIEVSHLSNLDEESRLRSPQYRQQIAQGIYDGLIEYMQSLGKG